MNSICRFDLYIFNCLKEKSQTSLPSNSQRLWSWSVVWNSGCKWTWRPSGHMWVQPCSRRYAVTLLALHHMPCLVMLSSSSLMEHSESILCSLLKLTRLHCINPGFNPNLFNESTLVQISVEFAGVLSKGPSGLHSVISPWTRSESSTLWEPLSWDLQLDRTEQNRAALPGSGPRHNRKCSLQGKRPVLAEKRDEEKWRETGNIHYYPALREKGSSRKWGGKSQFQHTGMKKKLLLGISSRGRSGIGRMHSGVVHFLVENQRKCVLVARPPPKFLYRRHSG